MKSLSKLIYLFIGLEEGYLQYSHIVLKEWRMVIQEQKQKRKPQHRLMMKS